MAKSKTFTYNGETPGTVYVPGVSQQAVEPGDTVEADSEAAIAALEANPDFLAGKRKSGRKD